MFLDYLLVKNVKNQFAELNFILKYNLKK